MNKFAEWMINNDKKQRGVAEKLGISKSTLNDLFKKDKLPSLKIAYSIEKYTRGAITVYDWLDQWEEENKAISKIEAKQKTKKITQ